MPRLQLGKTATYRLYDSEDALLYVGITSDPQSRWRNHTVRSWWPNVARKSVTWHDTRELAEADESQAINEEHPLHNVRNVPRVVPGQSPQRPELHIPVKVMRDQLGERLDATHYGQAVTIVTKHGEPYAVLVPVDWYQRHKAIDLTGEGS